MEKITVQFPFVHVLNPSTGRNLGLGFAYFGVIDGDPYNNPADRVPVYAQQPDGANLLISQPVLLNAAGLFVYNGSPAQILVDDEYSLDVRTSANVQAYYAPRVATFEKALFDLLGNQQIKSLYDYPESNFEGDCSAAMDLALADNNVLVVIVPDNVILKRHVFDSPHKTIVGGNNVTFTGNSAGLYPRVCEYVHVTQFRNAQLPIFPISGGTASNGAIFVSTAPAHNIGTLIVDDCSTYGGRIGAALGPEGGSGQIRNLIRVTGNTFEQCNGVSAGSGYGIQYANELLTGMAYIANNTIIRSCRNGLYIARNAGQAPVYVYNNHVIDHRLNADNKGAGAFPAFNVARSSNVHGYGNQSTRPYDGSLLIGPEYDGAAVLDSKNITWRDFTINSPQNAVPQIFIEYLDVPATARTAGILLDGIDYTAVSFAAPLIDYAYGKRITISNVVANFFDITSGAYYLAILKGGTTANSGEIKFDRVRVYGANCVAASFSVFELAGAILTSDIRLMVDDIGYDVDSVSRVFWSPQAAVANTRIEAYRCGTSGMVFSAGVSWYRATNPSIQPLNRSLTIGFTSPNGNLTPQYVGEIVYMNDTNYRSFWQSTDTTNTGWICLGRLGGNLNRLSPGGANRRCAVGYAVTATEAHFEMDIESNVLPAGATVTSTFAVINPATGTPVTSGTAKTPALFGSKCTKTKAWITVLGLSGLTVGNAYFLESETGTSDVEITF